MRFVYSFILFLLSLLPASAQGMASIAGPSLGFAYDSSLSAIRPIRGIPGAAILGDPIDSGFTVAAAAISPQQDFALALSADDHQVRLIRFENGRHAAVSINNAMVSPDRMIFSPSGNAAVFYQQSSGRLQILTGLPKAPTAQDLGTAAFNGSQAGLAVSDDGTLVLLAPGGQDSDPVWLLGADGSSLQLPLPGSSVAVSFRRDSHDVLALTRAGDLFLARNVDSNSDFSRVHAGDGQTSGPVAVQFSPDGARAYTANATGTLAAFDLATGSASMISCQCSPTGLQPLSSGVLFRLNEASRPPLLLLDGSGAAPRVWFVPLAQTSADLQRSRQ
jgi:DNA-binding beta-propeller fold protein YncE